MLELNLEEINSVSGGCVCQCILSNGSIVSEGEYDNGIRCNAACKEIYGVFTSSTCE